MTMKMRLKMISRANRYDIKGPTIIHKIFEMFSCEIAPYGKSSRSIFQEFLASIEKIFILAGRLGTSL